MDGVLEEKRSGLWLLPLCLYGRDCSEALPQLMAYNSLIIGPDLSVCSWGYGLLGPPRVCVCVCVLNTCMCVRGVASPSTETLAF